MTTPLLTDDIIARETLKKIKKELEQALGKHLPIAYWNIRTGEEDASKL